MRALWSLTIGLFACHGPKAAHEGGHHHHGHQGGMPHRFEDAETWAKEFDDPARDAWQKPDEVVAIMAIAPGMVVADLGAGTGYFEGRLSKAVGDGRVLALDVEADMVRYLGERAAKEGWTNVTAMVVGPADPGLAEASVDRILIADTWHHLPDREAYAQRLAKALRPGGQVHVVDFVAESERGPPPEHRIPPEVVVAAFVAAGLTAIVVDETLPDQYIVVATKPR